MPIDREKWTFPAKPNLPHTMSIDFGAQAGDNTADSTVVMAGVPCNYSFAHRVLIVLTQTSSAGFTDLFTTSTRRLLGGRCIPAMQHTLDIRTWQCPSRMPLYPRPGMWMTLIMRPYISWASWHCCRL